MFFHGKRERGKRSLGAERQSTKKYPKLDCQEVGRLVWEQINAKWGKREREV